MPRHVRGKNQVAQAVRRQSGASVRRPLGVKLAQSGAAAAPCQILAAQLVARSHQRAGRRHAAPEARAKLDQPRLRPCDDGLGRAPPAVDTWHELAHALQSRWGLASIASR